MNHEEKGTRVPTVRLKSLLLAILLTLFGAAALAQEGTQQEEAAQQETTTTQPANAADDTTATDAATDDAATEADSGETVIQLGQDDVVTRGEFEQEFERATRALALQQGLPYNQQTRELFERFRADFLEQLAVRNALLAEAQARGISVSDQEVDAQVAQVRENLGEERFQQAIQDLGYDSIEAFRESVREGLLTQQVIDELRAGIDPSDEEVQAFFEENQDLFAGQSLEQVRDQVEARLVDQRLTEQFAGLQQQHGIQTFPDRVVVATEAEEGVAGGGEAGTPAQTDGQSDGQTEGETDDRIETDGERNTVEGEIEGDVVTPEVERPNPENEADPNTVPAVEDVEEQQDVPGRQEGEDNQQDDR